MWLDVIQGRKVNYQQQQTYNQEHEFVLMIWFDLILVFNATFSNIPAISWRPNSWICSSTLVLQHIFNSSRVSAMVFNANFSNISATSWRPNPWICFSTLVFQHIFNSSWVSAMVFNSTFNNISVMS